MKYIIKKTFKYLIKVLPQKSLRKKLKNKYVNEYSIQGSNNRLILFSGEKEEEFIYNPSINIIINGDNNILRIHKTAQISGQIFIAANNVEITFGSNTYCNMTLICDHGNNQRFILDNNSTVGFIDCRLNEEKSSVIIGKNCMLSSRIDIIASDGHAIIDTQKNIILNELVRPVLIGDNCWIGMGVILTKNACIPENTIVGTGSVVTKKFTEKNTIIAGNPAKVIKKGIIWHRSNPFCYKSYLQEKENEQ